VHGLGQDHLYVNIQHASKPLADGTWIVQKG
jgi:hypothetical protein